MTQVVPRATMRHLELLNEQLQRAVEELNTTKDDLEARSLELQESAIRLDFERQASEAERDRLAAILQSMGDAVVVLARDGSVLVRNQAYADLMADRPGASMDDENGQPLPASKSLEARASRGEEFRMIVTRADPDGGRCWYEAVSRRVGPGADQKSTVLVVRDITDRSLRRIQDEFMAVASHELRTPLAVLTGYLHLLERSVEGQAAEHARRALQHADDLEELVGDLLDITRLETGQMRYEREPVDLGQVVQDAVAAARILSDPQRIEFARPARTVLVDADPTRISQVLRNLLDNARVHAGPDATIRVSLRRRAGRAEVSVQDDGPGISPGEVESVFERFHGSSSSARRGLGLGLHIAREIARGHHGTLVVASGSEQGATFTLRLPLLKERRARPAAPKPAGTAAGPSGATSRRAAAGR